jgi:hypothetical protein
MALRMFSAKFVETPMSIPVIVLTIPRPRAITKNKKNPMKMPRMTAAIIRRGEGLVVVSAINFYLHG